ncbi:MAG TPA: hypothetical protein EYQ30_00835 [Gammaproteobacteria bacterium]|nr:hypothetical protein [Gammaproteobacteria bacterium]HIL63319.1 hypothetical protein [Porticoccaceae bacterium]
MGLVDIEVSQASASQRSSENMMNKSNKWDDKEIAATGTAVIILGGLILYWLLQMESTLELLELAYGSVKLFNNPLVF